MKKFQGVLEMLIWSAIYVLAVYAFVRTIDLQKHPLPTWFLVMVGLGSVGWLAIILDSHNKRGLWK